MTTPDTQKPWISLVELIEQKIPVPKLATAIENIGIHMYDRFDRRIELNRITDKEQSAREKALDFLAQYYAEIMEEHYNQPGWCPEVDPDHWLEFDSPLFRFGWPGDELPNFDDISIDVIPEEVTSARSKLDIEPKTRTKRTLLVIINALCKASNIDPGGRGSSMRIKEMTELEGTKVSDNTIRGYLEEIPEAIEQRSA